jgi:hypothetical protein
MNEEEKKLKLAFRKLMDEEFKDIPSFEELNQSVDQDYRTLNTGRLTHFIRPMLKYAAIVVPIGLLTYFILLKEDTPKTDLDIINWEMASNELLPDQQELTTISNWQSPTDFLLNTKLTNNEE